MQEPFTYHVYDNEVTEKQKQVQEAESMEHKKSKSLTLIPLIFMIYFQVSGGPYGQESAVGASGPLFAILGFVSFPILWSIPEALATAELSSAFRVSNGGYVVWAHAAFGPFWAHLMGCWKFAAGAINMASFPVLCTAYVEAVAPSLVSSAVGRFSVVVFSTSALSIVNLSGLHVAAYASIPLGALSLIPFLALSVAAIPKIDPSNWIVTSHVGRGNDWKRFFNSLFWNLNSWDAVSTFVGEISSPEKTLPKALAASLGFTSVANLVPLLASVGAMSLDRDDWVDGYYADIAEEIVGPWLKKWVKIGSVLSLSGLYQAQLGACSYQLQGMAELGLIPSLFGQRCARFGTPWAGIVASTVVSIVVAGLRLESNLRIAVNVLYGMGVLFVFASFLYLRVKLPDAERPFRVPIGFRRLVGMCSVPCAFVFYVLCVASAGVYLLCLVVSVVGVVCYILIKIFRSNKMWFHHHFSEADENQKPLKEGVIVSYYEKIVK